MNTKISENLITRQSQDGRYVTGYRFFKSPMVTANFREISCIHSNPSIGPAAPGEVYVNYGRIYLREEDPKRLLARWHQDPAPYTVHQRVRWFRRTGLSALLT